MTSSNSEVKKRGPKPKPDKRGRTRKASSDYRTREKEKKARMIEVATAAEKLHKAVEEANANDIWYSAFMLGATPLETLHNITAYIVNDSKKAGRRGKSIKEKR